jgi:histidine phosphotransfer protein HptB
VTDNSPIDRDKLATFRQELGPHFARILGYFAEDGAKSIDVVEEAVRKRDAVAIVRPAHTLKGEALQFGAVVLGLAAEEVEKIARQAVEDQQWPFDMVKYAVRLRPLFQDALAALDVDAAPAPAPVPAPRPTPASVATPAAPLRRPAGGFGRNVG